jgi:hypothetical protein
MCSRDELANDTAAGKDLVAYHMSLSSSSSESICHINLVGSNYKQYRSKVVFGPLLDVSGKIHLICGGLGEAPFLLRVD